MTNQEKRQVLLYAPEGSSSELYDLLAAHNWSVTLSNTLLQAQSQLTKLKPHVGIIEFPATFQDPDLAKLERLLAIDSAINWILILPQLQSLSEAWLERIQILISNYCFDYHHLPLQADLLLPVLGHAHGMSEIIRHPSRVNTSDYAQFGIIGKSQPMQLLYRQIKKVCALDDPVLISGETGTGKELVANAIHYHSARTESQLVVINCGSLADSLVQAELFGYEKGAFTGAYKRKIGRIEASNGGTLFLDEIGDLPLSQQANLLRFLQQKTIVRVGGYEEIPVDIRVIAATNIDLKKAVKEGRFREDLFYRLNVLHIVVPPLRDRDDDVELLCRYFLNNDLSAASRSRVRGLSAEALQVINNHDWRGNVRELANTIRHAQIMSDARLIRPVDLDLEKRNRPRTVSTLEETRADAERSAIRGSLRQCQHNISQAAELLGISRVTLHRLINKYQLKL